MRTWALAVIVAAGCGRIGFDVDTTSGLGSDGASGDGPTAVSCGTLAPTCGPLSSSPCCESPVVPGGTYARSYDVSTDGMYPDGSYSATVSTFRLDKYEVTVGRFRQFVVAGAGTQASPPTAGDGAHPNLSNSGWDASWNGSLTTDATALAAAVKCNPTFQTWTDAEGGNENRPMNCVTWYEAAAFCAWDGAFLPTEAEWNYAAAGGSEQRSYPWANPPASLVIDETRASYAVNATTQCFGDGINGCALTDLVPVGSKPLGDGQWGQSDLAGNVYEWTLDWYASPYPQNPCIDCANLTPATVRVFRGGCFGNGAIGLRGSARFSGTPTVRDSNLGFRCARKP